MALKEAVTLGQVDREYYQPLLKRRVLQGLREEVRFGRLQEREACEEMRLRKLRVCFDGFREFNRREREKVKRFRLEKGWGLFSFGLAYDYY